MRTVMLSILLTVTLLAGFETWRSPHRYAQQDREQIGAPASQSFLFGTDDLGRDRAERLSVAVLLSVGGACLAGALAGSASVALGMLASLAPQLLRAALLYISDIVLILPTLFLLMLARSALPLNLDPLLSGALTFLLLAMLGVPVFLRLNQGRSTSLLQTEWYAQAHAMGLRQPQLCQQLLPHMRRLFWSQFLLFVPACLIAEANLGTLGLGLAQPLPSLGNFLAGLQTDMLLNASRWSLLPVALLIVVLIALEMTVFGELE